MLHTTREMTRVGQNRICTLFMTVHMVASLPKMLYIHCIYMVLVNPRNDSWAPSPKRPGCQGKVVESFTSKKQNIEMQAWQEEMLGVLHVAILAAPSLFETP